jgi:uncharacterized membrane protein
VRPARAVLVAAFVAFVSLLTYLDILRFRDFAGDAWDIGTFSQALWSAVHGGLFMYNIEPFFGSGFPQHLSISFFAVHFSPSLALLVPIFAIWPHTETMYFIVHLLLLLPVFPVYFLAEKRLGEVPAILFAFAYLLYTPFFEIPSMEIEVLVFFFFSFALYFGIERKWTGFAICFVLGMFSVEYVAAIGLCMLAYLYLLHRDFSRKEFTLFGVLTALALVGMLSSPMIQGALGFNPSIAHGITSNNWKVLGASDVFQIPSRVLESPSSAVAALSADWLSKVAWLAFAFAPVLFLPFFFHKKGLIMGIGWVVPALFSNYYPYFSPVYAEYTLLIAFFVFPIGILALTDFYKKFEIKKQYYAVIPLFMLLMTCFITGASVPYFLFYSRTTESPHAALISSLLPLVPENGTILTTSDIFPHLTPSTNLYTIPDILVLTQGITGDGPIIIEHLKPQYVVVDCSLYENQTRPDVMVAVNQILNYTSHNHYGTIVLDQGFLLMGRNYTSPPLTYNATASYSPTCLSYAGSFLVTP